MKKLLKIVGTAIAMILLAAIGAVGGFLLTASLFSGFFNPLEVGLSLLGIFLLFYASIIIHEAGHLVFGLISGYSFSSFRIASFMWIKQDGKIKLRRLSIAGTGGQCLMAPPKRNDGKMPVILFNLGGVIANLIFAILCLMIYYLLLNKQIVVALVFLFGAIISFAIALTNGLPLNIGGISNDGMNAIHLSKNKNASAAFYNQLLMNSAQAKGVRLSDMPEEWFVLPEGADMQNVHNASIAVFAASRALDRLDTISAEQEISALLKSGYNITGLHKSLLKCDLVYAKLINSGKNAEISSLLTLDQLKFMKSMKKFPSVLRTEYTLALIRDNDENKAKKIKANFEIMAKKYPYPTDIESELALIDLAFERYKNPKIA